MLQFQIPDTVSGKPPPGAGCDDAGNERPGGPSAPEGAWLSGSYPRISDYGGNPGKGSAGSNKNFPQNHAVDGVIIYD